jgi:hypothetical protein
MKNLTELIQLHTNSLESTDNTLVLSEQDVNTLLTNGKQSLEEGVVNFTKLLNNDTIELTKYPYIKETLANYQDTLRLIRTLTSYIVFEQGLLSLSDTSFAKLNPSNKPSLEQIEPLFNAAKLNY